MKKYFLLLLTSATLGLTTSCSPFQVRSDYAETANFNTYKTYKLRIDDLKLNDIDKDRVPVSYTHLDVYKRQDLQLCCRRQVNCLQNQAFSQNWQLLHLYFPHWLPKLRYLPHSILSLIHI